MTKKQEIRLLKVLAVVVPILLVLVFTPELPGFLKSFIAGVTIGIGYMKLR